jgi:predicted nucleotidyltransferase component of viral defense system
MNVARKQNEDFQLVLTRYALERLLYRLSQSEHRDVFTLKGAMLFQLWGNQPHRPTRDLDLMARGDSSIPRFAHIFREVCERAVEANGLVFSAKSVRGDTIKEDQEYAGLRLNLDCRLEIRATFERRRTPVPAEVPVALSSEFAQDRAKQTQWRAFIGKGKLDTGGAGLDEVVVALRGFLKPPAEAAVAGGLLEMIWPASGPWRPL